MKVQHGIVDAMRRKPLQDALHDRAVADRKRRLGADERKGTEAGRQTQRSAPAPESFLGEDHIAPPQAELFADV
jgi:hypothetical protein